MLYVLPSQVGGTEIYARRLLAALAAQRPDVEFVAFVGIEAFEALSLESWPENVCLKRLPVRVSNKPLRLAAELTALPLAAHREGVQVLHSLGTTSPPFSSGRRIVTVHDLIYEHYPETFPWPARVGLSGVVGPAARRADRVIASSESGRADIVERLGVDPMRVSIVHHGVDVSRSATPTPEREIRERFGLGSGPVVLCVSAALAHKNLARLLRAFARLARKLSGVRLVLAGHRGLEADRLAALADSLGIAASIRLTGWVTDADLEGLYAAASCFVYPSLHEGFGLPLLEAMSRGVPLACADATSLPEVAGDAAELFDPLEVEAIATAMQRLLEDEVRRRELVERGRERVRAFSWERCARETLAVYDLALDQS